MKINDTNRVSALNHYRKQSHDYQAQTDKLGKKKDQLQISSQAKEMLEIQASEKINSIEKQERLEQLKEEVNSGTYRVADEKLVDKLLPYFRQIDEE
ncbi:flagellar biosynthesis anti-sigma factor FlgM [Longirhabdus pacifica]|uniref:flagellar biosynthesis anti-sigma factor FlgM n=1 Tax=Longirhabdus pacifica TaxID=2305227 RepID=UPI001008CD12|nr:flagellar biosynthesis anti-sigma factor FlgM [Longirhabdus pacifica]